MKMVRTVMLVAVLLVATVGIGAGAPITESGTSDSVVASADAGTQMCTLSDSGDVSTQCGGDNDYDDDGDGDCTMILVCGEPLG
ncbi:hypothetical protein [Halorussus sp. MSC15.2]|uniref:hypothetical protein n=1 Tax=Halorussus sp. MSC15.2 TaxID=2283638 RepID=UPI0013D768C6|nr:hypothetical protein [Halorussus sp. MSC15.2]NEU55595.1 hypothetical protein [Halorussus sp. MSC15.2]